MFVRSVRELGGYPSSYGARYVGDVCSRYVGCKTCRARSHVALLLSCIDGSVSRRDTTLTADDYRYLYLGYSFQEDYNPYRVSFYNTAIDTLYNRCSHTPEECKELVRYAHRILADNPFDLRRMAVLVYANNLLDNESEVLFWQARIHHLVDAIISTGDGCTPETAWYIIEPVHAYDLLNTLGVIAESYDFCPPCYDYIQVYDLIGNARGFYFNVSRILEEYQRKFVDE